MVFSPRIKLFIMKSINKIYHTDKLNIKNNIVFPIGYPKRLQKKIQEPLTSIRFLYIEIKMLPEHDGDYQAWSKRQCGI